MHNMIQVVVSCSQSGQSINIQISKFVNKNMTEMRRLSDHETERLIELWHVEECLWKVTDSRYSHSDANCRKPALERISKEMDGIDVSE